MRARPRDFWSRGLAALLRTLLDRGLHSLQVLTADVRLAAAEANAVGPGALGIDLVVRQDAATAVGPGAQSPVGGDVVAVHQLLHDGHDTFELGVVVADVGAGARRAAGDLDADGVGVGARCVSRERVECGRQLVGLTLQIDADLNAGVAVGRVLLGTRQAGVERGRRTAEATHQAVDPTGAVVAPPVQDDGRRLDLPVALGVAVPARLDLAGVEDGLGGRVGLAALLGSELEIPVASGRQRCQAQDGPERGQPERARVHFCLPVG